MDEYSGKRTNGGFSVTGRGSGLAFRDASNHEDRSSQYCNRLVCSNRPNSMRSTKIGSSDREKFSNSIHSTSGKAIVGSSSKTYSAVTNLRKPHLGLPNTSSHKEKVEEEISEPSSLTSSSQMNVKENGAESDVLKGISIETFEEIGSYSLASGRTQKQIQKRSSPGNQETSLASSSRFSFSINNPNQGVKSASHGHCSNSSRSSTSTSSASRYSLRNLRCTSISDVLTQSYPSSDPSHSKRAVVMKKKSPDGDCSSSRGKITSESSCAGNSQSHRNSFCNTSSSLSERSPSQPASRRTRYWPSTRKDVTSVRTRRLIGETRSEASGHGNGNNETLSDPPVPLPQGLQTTSSVSESSPSGFSQQSTHDLPPSDIQNSFVGLGRRNENVHNRPRTHLEYGSGRLFNSLSIDQDDLQRFNIDGIAEILLALERIEQNEELTYEQLLVLETNLFLGSLRLHDQHREMRLDIDNMSYEELLALGEKMGTVSTALTEDQLSNCIQSNSFIPGPRTTGGMGCGDDDVKCSICQEEFAEGGEMGLLKCDHRYHMVCIHQWLQLKNWCPICKAHAAA